MPAKPVKTLNLALQGGGSHGALTWGVLDRFLEDERIRIAAVSGTSAGAMNAVVLADGLVRDGRDGARQALSDFWRAVSDAASFSPLQRGVLDWMTGSFALDNSPAYLMFDIISRQFSPYELNPLDINPLRDLVSRTVNFDRVNCCSETRVFVTATNVRTGRARIFNQPELSVDTVMASACLPLMFKAVEIDGEAYWDGGFIGNPALFPLVDEGRSRDIVVVQINPMLREETPRSARAILNRLNEITFNSSLIKELRSIELLHRLIDSENVEAERYRDMRVHIIHADEELEHLSASSKLNAEWSHLKFLRERGRDWANRFLDEHFDDLGVRSSFDVAGLFEDCFALSDAPPPHTGERITNKIESDS